MLYVSRFWQFLAVLKFSLSARLLFRVQIVKYNEIKNQFFVNAAKFVNVSKHELSVDLFSVNYVNFRYSGWTELNGSEWIRIALVACDGYVMVVC